MLDTSRWGPLNLFGEPGLSNEFQSIFDNALIHQWPAFALATHEAAITEIRGAAIRTSMLAPHCLFATIYAGECYRSYFSGEPPHNEMLQLQLKQEALSHLRRALQDHKGVASDDVLWTITLLAIHGSVRTMKHPRFTTPVYRDNEYYSSVEFQGTHLRALRSLVAQKGGLETLKIHGLSNMVSMVDTFHSLMTVTEPVFPPLYSASNLVDSLQVTWDDAAWSRFASWQDGFVFLEAFRSGPRLRQIICQLRVLLETFSLGLRDPRRSPDLMLMVHTRRVLQHNALQVPSEGDCLFEAARLAFIVFVSLSPSVHGVVLVAAYAPVPGLASRLIFERNANLPGWKIAELAWTLPVIGGFHEKVTKLLLRALDECARCQHWQTQPEFLLWATVIGGLAARQGSRVPDFATRLRDSSMATEKDSWADVKSMSLKFLPLEYALGDLCHTFWDEACDFLSEKPVDQKVKVLTPQQLKKWKLASASGYCLLRYEMARLTRYNIIIGMIVATGTFGYGFGFGVFVTSIGQPGFYKDFNLDREYQRANFEVTMTLTDTIATSKYTANVLGAVNALFAAGAAFGSLFQASLTDWIGRKKSLAASALFSLIGAAWTAGSPYLAMLITTRILHGFGLGMLICLVPLYLTEISPPHCRGIMSGMTVMGFGLGYVAVAWVSVATYFAKNETLQWRLPLALACVGPLGLLLGIYFVPGRHEEALQVIQRLHRDPSDPEDSSAQAEFIQIRAQVEKDKEQKSGYVRMFTKPSWRKRSLLVLFLMFGSQATGVNGIVNYLVRIFGTLGLKGVMPLLIYAVYTIVGTTAAFVACFTMDKFGRRKLFREFQAFTLLPNSCTMCFWFLRQGKFDILICVPTLVIGFPALAVDLLIEALLQRQYLGSTNQTGNGVAVACIFLFIILFQFIDAPSFVWCSEIFPTTIRAKGIGLSMFSYFVGFITFSTPGPLAFRNITWRFYLIFMALCIVCEVVVYLFIPETRGRPVEEMGALFGDDVVLHLTLDGRGLVEKTEGMVLEQIEVVDLKTQQQV
ncbi:hypothetical protein AYO22_02118 [Fonsecaea multimorphosa]|nr:hypothetical protein AYO22_02118 [Fonsecaea multimorphosa]